MKEKFKVGDKLRILDGSNIQSYRGGWTSDMDDFVGDIVTVESISEPLRGWNFGYRMKECGFLWDEIGLELAETDQITINRYGNKVVAKMGKKTGVARCNETDPFDLYTGVKIAVDRLFGKESEVEEVKRRAKVGEYIKIVSPRSSYDLYKTGDIFKVKGFFIESYGDVYVDAPSFSPYIDSREYVVLENYKPQDKPREEKPKYYNGKVVCVDNAENAGRYTVGKIYTFKDGKMIDSDDKITLNHTFVSLEHFKNWSSSKFIKLVEDK